MTPEEERRLLDRWKGGDVEAFGELARRYEPRVIGYLSSWTRDPAEREDLYQETLLRLFAQGRRLPDGAPFAFLVLKVARNLALDLHRRKSVRRTAPPGPAPEAAPTPEQAALGAEARRRACEALDRVPSDEREALTLKLWGNLTWRQVGEALQCSEDAAARRGAAGLARMARELGEAP